jgi:uncharacterized membrane protein
MSSVKDIARRPREHPMSTIERSRRSTGRRSTGRRSTGHRNTGQSQRPRGRLARWLAAPGWVLMLLACLAIVSITSQYLTFNPEVYFPEQLQVYLRHEFALGVHVLSGVLALLIGPWQFVGRLRRRFVRFHRYLGAAYVASATGLGVSGLFLAPTAYTGVGASIAFTTLALTMLFTTWTAVRMVAAGRYGDHRRWMIRSFSLILAGVMLRVWIPTYYILAGVGIVSFSFETAYAVVAWLAWVPNLLIAIWVTRHPAPVANAA